MASDITKRRFAPVPVETSVKSSKSKKEEAAAPTSDKTTLRRFAVEPVEQSVKRSGHLSKPPQDESAPSARKFAIEPIEQSVRRGAQVNGNASPASETSSAPKTTRKFAIQPVETTTKSSKASKDSVEAESADAPKKPRKFAVQPVETSAKSSKTKEQGETDPQSRRKFAIEPVETSSRSSKAADSDKPKARFAPEPVESHVRHHRSSHTPLRRNSELDETPADIPKGVQIRTPTRKFAPQLIDTSSRSRRTSDEKSPVPHHFRTDVTPGHMVNAAGESLFPGLQETKRAPLPHERRKERLGTTHGNVRSHSFLCPDLETIESSESEASESGSPQRSTSPSTNNDSPLPTSTGAEAFNNGMGESEGQSEAFSKYMLDLEAKRAEQMLQEQALAAFPNSDFHEPVEHYVDEDDDIIIDDRPATWEGHDDDDDEEEATQPQTWRQNTTKVDWDLIDMKKHQEKLEESREQARIAALKQKSEQGSGPWWNPAAVRDFGTQQPDSEMSQMLNRARPPMLGSDLKFPRSSSPEPARFDITQGSHVLRSQMCYLTEQADAKSNSKTVNGLWGGAASPAKANSGEKGLWAGLCKADSQGSQDFEHGSIPSGLITPAIVERANPFDESLSHRVAGLHLRPPTPPHSRRKLQQQGVVLPQINQVLNTDQELDELMAKEYPDTFITQVFNYLSLGYPSLARPFDDELSKITTISISELRRDDELAKSMPKGYIRVGEDFVGREDGTSQALDDADCMRWRALKKYIREWARQEKGMVHVQAVPWGAAARKGSWAW